MDTKPISDHKLTPLSELLSTLTPELARIPVSHQPLLDGPYWVALTTVTPGGPPQTTPIWCNRQGGDYVLFNTMHGFLKERTCGLIRG